MTDSKREYKGIFRGNSLEDNSYRGPGLVSYDDDLRPTVLTREIPSYASFPQPTVYRSLDSDSSEFGEGLDSTIYRSIKHDSSFSSSEIPPRPKLLASTSDILPRSKLGASSKISPFFSSPTNDDVLALVQSSVISKDLPKEPPPVPGGYLEPSYHFVSRSKPLSLFGAIPQALISIRNKKDIPGIDFDINAKKYKVKCVAYPCGEPKLPFVVSVFFLDPDDKGKRYALEFQRRSGDVVQFSNIWAKCKRYFQDNDFLTEKSTRPKVPRLPKLEVSIGESQTRDALKCLLQMADSSCCDVKSQAVAALSKMSTEEQHHTLMLEEGCLEVFIAAVDYPVEDVHRCAVSALANLSQNRAPVCQKIAEKNGLKSLCHLTKSCTKEIVRESLRALLSIVQLLGRSVIDDQIQRTLESHRDSSDPVTQHAVKELQKLQL